MEIVFRSPSNASIKETVIVLLFAGLPLSTSTHLLLGSMYPGFIHLIDEFLGPLESTFELVVSHALDFSYIIAPLRFVQGIGPFIIWSKIPVVT